MDSPVEEAQETVSPPTTMDLAQRFITLTEHKDAVAKQLDDLKEELERLGNILMNQFIESGTRSIKTMSGHSVFLRRDLYVGAKDKDTPALLRVLKQLAEENPQFRLFFKEEIDKKTLAGYVREKAKEPDEPREDDALKFPDDILGKLPEPLRAVIHISEKFDVRCSRKSS